MRNNKIHGNKWTLSLANLFMSGFFVYAAYVQQNDPDSVVWILIYLSNSLIALIAAFSAMNFSFSYLDSILIYMIFAISTFFLYNSYSSEDGRLVLDFSPKTERGRESGGLTIALFWNTVNFVSRKTFKRSKLFFSLLLIFSVGVASSIYVIPKYFLNVQDTTGHCQGLGITPQKREL